MVWIGRVLMLIAFALYWGGLTFYTGFVVRVSHDILGDPMDGGLITQRATAILQILCTIAVSLMAINAVLVVRRSRTFGYALLGCVLVTACALVGLFAVHGHLDAVIDVQASQITDRDAFTTSHRRYNQLTTAQWLASLAYLPITIFGWRSIDSNHSSQK